MNPSGAKLIAGGTTAPDTIVLTASVAPSYAGFAILLKSRIEDIAGIPHDDGLRCVSGSLVWFGGHSAGTHGAPQGQWTYPNSVQTLAISIATQQTPGESAFYQLLYRDPTPGFCSAGTTNLSNGFSINWP
jgi:hypothetical protein